VTIKQLMCENSEPFVVHPTKVSPNLMEDSPHDYFFKDSDALNIPNSDALLSMATHPSNELHSFNENFSSFYRVSTYLPEFVTAPNVASFNDEQEFMSQEMHDTCQLLVQRQRFSPSCDSYLSPTALMNNLFFDSQNIEELHDKQVNNDLSLSMGIYEPSNENWPRLQAVLTYRHSAQSCHYCG
jgi:hypothetical protein